MLGSSTRSIFLVLAQLLVLILGSGVVIGGFDNDGDLDAVFANAGEPNRVCLGNGSGGFTTCSNVGTGVGGGIETTAVALAEPASIGDMDSDGVLDDADNCPTVYNPLQIQTGNNVGGPFGDACVSPDVDTGGATIIPGAIIESGVQLNKGVTVNAGAVVKAGAVLNKGSTVEANAVISENAVLNQGSKVGEGAIIGVNTVLDRGAEVHDGAKLGDNSRLGRDSDILANAVVGCFAAPTSFLPGCPGAAFGVQIGKNFTVAANAVVADGDVLP